MPARKVFGKRATAQHDSFASMLNSSPEIKVDEVKTIEKHRPDRPVTQVRPSPRKTQMQALQAISVNISRPVENATSDGRPPRKSQVDSLKIKTLISAPEKTAPQESCIKPKKAMRVRCEGQGSETTRAARTPLVPQQHTSEQAANVEQCIASICPYTEHCQPLLQLFRQEVEDFSAWSSQISEHLSVTKIAEASFGEVYRLSLKADQREIHVSHHEESVLKVIALTPHESTIPKTTRERNRMMKKAALMSKPADVASEVRLLQRMSNIPGFTQFRELRILQGRPPSAFVKAYKQYNHAQQANGKDPSTFPDPAKRTSYNTDQLWAVIEMRDAGTDLERVVEGGTCKDIWSIWDIFWQTTLALAKGEESAEFEHRDLHLGNICVGSRGTAIDVDVKKSLGFTQHNITLIDYTISRAKMALDNTSNNQDIAYLDLSQDQHIFNGDSAQEYQYDIYRYMRSALFFDDPLTSFVAAQLDSSRTWSQFHPQTNLVWLHFILHTLLAQLNSTNAWPKPSCKAERLLRRRAQELERNLAEVNALLQPGMLKYGPKSASMLVATALQREWLQARDVLGLEESSIDLVSEIAALDLQDTT